MILNQPFFNRPTLTVARELLGKHLVRSHKGKQISALITEVEAYNGPDDLACHASRGRTKRTEVMFGPAGHFYLYFIYGMYWMLNVVTGPKNFPAAVLIRGVGDWNGPGKLTKALEITKDLNGKRIEKSSGLWIEDCGMTVSKDAVKRMPRIGVDYAGACAKKPYRFILDTKVLTPLQ